MVAMHSVLPLAGDAHARSTGICLKITSLMGTVSEGHGQGQEKCYMEQVTMDVVAKYLDSTPNFVKVSNSPRNIMLSSLSSSLDVDKNEVFADPRDVMLSDSTMSLDVGTTCVEHDYKPLRISKPHSARQVMLDGQDPTLRERTLEHREVPEEVVKEYKEWGIKLSLGPKVHSWMLATIENCANFGLGLIMCARAIFMG